MKKSLLATLSLTALLAVSACTDHTEKREVMIPWAVLPIAVQHALVNELPGEKLLMVERESDHGAPVYEARSSDGMKVVKVDSDGKLLAISPKIASVAPKTVSWKHVPKAVRKTIVKNAHGMKVESVEKERLSGHTVYVATVNEADGSSKTITVRKNGKLVTDTAMMDNK